MKILLLSNKIPYPAKDGSSIAIKNMINSLLFNKAEVNLLALNTAKHQKSPEEIKAFKPSHLQLDYLNVNTSPSIINAFLNLWQKLPYHVSRFKIRSFQNKLIQFLKKNEFDIIQMEGLSMMVYLDIIKRYSTARISFRSHNVEYLIWQRILSYEKRPFHRAYFRAQANKLKNFELNRVSKTGILISITEEDQKIFRQQIKVNKSLNIPCGLNIEEYQNRKSEVKFDITYLASFDWLPNVQGIYWFLSEVWPLIIRERPGTTFALGGRKIPSSIKRLAKQTGINLHPQVPEMKDFISKGRIGIVPLQTGSGMRIKIIENMALGKAMISTHIGAKGIMIDPHKNIILADNPSEFTQAVVSLLDNDEKRKSIERAAKLTVQEHYNNRVLGKRLIDFYHKLI